MGLLNIFKTKAKADDNQVNANELLRVLFSQISFGVPIIDVVNQSNAVDKGYLYNHIVYSIIRRITTSMQGVPWQVYKVIDDKAEKKFKTAFKVKDYEAAMYYKAAAYEPDDKSEISRLLASPNETERLNDLIEGLASFYLITGNGYIYGLRRSGDKSIIRLYNMPAHLVEIIFGSYLRPVKGYRLSTFIDGEIPAEDVLHIKTFNPNYDAQGSWLYGISPISAAGNITTLSNYAYKTQIDNFAKYGVRGILSASKEGLTQEQAEQIKEKWQAIVDNRKGDIMVSGVPMTWTNVGLSPVDMQIIEQQKLTLRDLCMIYNVPSQLFGDSEHTTYNNMREARKGLVTDAVLPIMEKIKDGLNRFLNTAEQGLLIDYDLQAFAELQDDMATQVASLSQAWWLTGNEKRIAMGKQPIDDEIMDEVLLPSGYIPMSDYSFDEYSQIDTTDEVE